jgi:hypothetical protein
MFEKSRLSEVLGSDAATLPGTHAAVITAYLEYESHEVKLRMYPADTLEQARIFYERSNSIERVLALQHDGWTIIPNFHFGYMAKGFDWTNSSLSPEQYLSYWKRNIKNTHKVERHECNTYWKRLVKEKIAEPADRKAFDRDFTDTVGRHFAIPRPGIQCAFVWGLDEAERLDDRGQLKEVIKDRINQLLDALGEDKIDAK